MEASRHDRSNQHKNNLNAPFPSLVTGSGPISVGKQNGIWTIGYSVAGFGQSDPSMAQLTSGAVLVWDSVAQTFSQVPLINLFNFARFMAGSAVVNFATINVDTPILHQLADNELSYSDDRHCQCERITSQRRPGDCLPGPAAACQRCLRRGGAHHNHIRPQCCQQRADTGSRHGRDGDVGCKNAVFPQ